jgi:hypothetical protein
MDLTAANLGPLGGVYTSPYTFTINTTTGVQAICDDFADEIQLNETWTATVNTSLTGTLWGTTDSNVGGSYNPIKAYDEATWLASQLLFPTVACPANSGNCSGDISYAIWAVFYPNALNNLSGSANDLSDATWWMTEAATFGVPGGSNPTLNLHGFEILTPIDSTASWTGHNPQEFLLYVPEAPTSALLSFGVLGLLSLMLGFRGKVRTA